MNRFTADNDSLWLWLDEGMRPSDIFHSEVLDHALIDSMLEKFYAVPSRQPQEILPGLNEIYEQLYRQKRGQEAASLLNKKFNLGSVLKPQQLQIVIDLGPTGEPLS